MKKSALRLLKFKNISFIIIKGKDKVYPITGHQGPTGGVEV
jgi:hypothetical protein